MLGIQWLSNPPYGNHLREAWEHAISSVGRIMLLLIRQQTLDNETLSTVSTDVESKLNRRPPIPVSSSHITHLALLLINF